MSHSLFLLGKKLQGTREQGAEKALRRLSVGGRYKKARNWAQNRE